MRPPLVREGSLDQAILNTMAHDPYYVGDLVRDGDWVFDVGANIGAFARFVHGRSPKARIVCLEPVLGNVAVLKHNVDEFAQVEAVAIARHCGTIELHVFDLWASGCHSIYPLQASSTKIEVPAVSLKALFAKYGADRVRFLKLDCQGAEYDVIVDEAIDTLASVDYIALEVHGEIAAKDVYLGSIPDYDRKLRQIITLFQVNHTLIHGDPTVPDEVQVWKRLGIS